MRLKEIVGQVGPRRLLGRLLRGGRFPGALLMEGRPGTGRSTLAAALAQALLCERPGEDGDACGACDQCRVMLAGNHPDCTVLPRTGRPVPVEIIRSEVVEQAHISPLQARRRVFLLPDIELLQPAAANALLKVLEEPAPHCHLVLTKLPGRVVLPTILSRVQLLRLAPLGDEEVAVILQRGGIDRVTARERAATAGGSHAGLFDARLHHSCPIDDLMALLHERPTQGLIAAVLDALPNRPPDDSVTLAAWQRQVCRQWLDVLLAGIRRRLRHGGGRLVEDLERVLRARSELHLNFAPRQVLERLMLDAAPR
ncbi:MAG: hypothetical protein ACOCXA_05565 [Planctomycetota bacterium]